MTEQSCMHLRNEAVTLVKTSLTVMHKNSQTQVTIEMEDGKDFKKMWSRLLFFGMNSKSSSQTVGAMIKFGLLYPVFCPYGRCSAGTASRTC